jgi:hypothetical protein
VHRLRCSPFLTPSAGLLRPVTQRYAALSWTLVSRKRGGAGRGVAWREGRAGRGGAGGHPVRRRGTVGAAKLYVARPALSE